MTKNKKSVWMSDNGNMALVTAAISLVILISVLYIGLTILDGVESGTAQEAGEYATGTLTISDITADAELVNISSYTFELDTAADGVVSGHIEIDCSDTTAAVACLAAKTAINSNASLAGILTASNTTSTVILTYDTRTTDGNDITLSETMGNGTWGAGVTAMSGGVDDDTFYDTNTELTSSTASAYTMAGILPIVLIAVALLGTIMGLLIIYGRRD